MATTFGASVGILGTGTRPLPTWTLVVLLLLVLLVAVSVFYILWPIQWSFGFDANVLIGDYIESSHSSLDDMYRDLAIHLQDHVNKNQLELDKLFIAFRVGLVGLTAEVVVLLLGLMLAGFGIQAVSQD